MNTEETRSILGLEPADLDGHTIEELSDYLDAGRQPVDPAIEASASCQAALDSLERLRALTPELLAADIAEQPSPDESWVQRILGSIALDARAGRRIPIAVSAPDADIGITEGAVRGLIRGAERAVDGVVVGRCSFAGDVTVAGEAIRVRVEVSVPHGQPIHRLAAQLRSEITARLAAHTTINLTAVDIAVEDIQYSSNGEEEQG